VGRYRVCSVKGCHRKATESLIPLPYEYQGGMVDVNSYNKIIADLRGLEYDDFANDKYATPKLQMITDFQRIGRNDIVAKVKNGDFDQ